MDKRTIVSKGDGLNYLGFAPDGSIHNMRKIKGGFYRYMYKHGSGTPVGDALKKSQFTLEE